MSTTLYQVFPDPAPGLLPFFDRPEITDIVAGPYEPFKEVDLDQAVSTPGWRLFRSHDESHEYFFAQPEAGDAVFQIAMCDKTAAEF